MNGLRNKDEENAARAKKDGYTTTHSAAPKNEIMSAETLHPQSALPAGVEAQGLRATVEKWNTSPGGPLERHVQTSSGENGGQTSSGEHGGEPGSDHNSLMDEEHQQQPTAAGDVAAVAAIVSKGEEKEQVQVAARAVDDLECHKPVTGEGGNLDNHDLSGGKKVDIEKGTESPPVASSEPAAVEHVTPSDSINPEAATVAHDVGSNPMETKAQTLAPVNPSRAEDESHKSAGAQDLLRQAMSTRQLQSKYEEVFGVPTKVHNKDWILSKISERVKLEVPVVKAPKDQPSAKSQRRGQPLGGGAAGVKGSEKQAGVDGAGAASRKIGTAPAGDIPVGQMRCSRNDGKNWRCSEMAMPGHKHCPKHMRWSAGGRGAAGKQQQGQGQKQSTAGVKRPRWLSAADGPGGQGGHQGRSAPTAGGAPPLGMPYGAPPPHLMPPGASNPLVAAPLLSAAASALDELHNKEESDSQRHLRQALGGMMPPDFGLCAWPGAPHMGFIPGVGGTPGAAPYGRFIPSAAATYRPTPTKAPFSFDSLSASTTNSVRRGGLASPPGSSPNAASAAAAVASTTVGTMGTGVDCTIEVVPMPGAGSSAETAGGKLGGGEPPAKVGGCTVRTRLNLALLTSFDALHCSIASVVSAPPPAGGRHDPSALQIVYCDVNGAPTVLGGESWQVFLSRARSVHARLLVPMDEHKKNISSNASEDGTKVIPTPTRASAPAHAHASASQGILPPPFAEMQAQWATMGLDPNIMMAMMMYAAAASGASYAAPR